MSSHPVRTFTRYSGLTETVSISLHQYKYYYLDMVRTIWIKWLLLLETKIAMTNEHDARANKKVDYQITATNIKINNEHIMKNRIHNCPSSTYICSV